MVTIKIILAVLCIVLSCIAIGCFLSARQLLNKNSEKELDSVMPKIEKLLKILEIIIYLLVSVSVLFTVVSIIQFVIS